MGILNANAIEKAHRLIFEAGVVDSSLMESRLLCGHRRSSLGFFLPSSGYGAYISTCYDDGFEVILLDVPLVKWDGVASWNLTHLSINQHGNGSRMLRGKVEGEFTVENGIGAIELLKILINQYPSEIGVELEPLLTPYITSLNFNLGVLK